MPQRPRPAPAMCTASVFVPGQEGLERRRPRRACPWCGEKRCRHGVQPPHISTASQAMSRGGAGLAVLASRLTRSDFTRSRPVVPVTVRPSSASMPRARARSVRAGSTAGADVDDGGGLRAGLGEVEGGVPGAVVGGDDRRAVADLDAVAVEVGLGGAGEHHARAVVAVEDQRLLERALGEHDLAGAHLPHPLARGALGRRRRGGRSGAGRGRRGSGGSSRSPWCGS